MLVEGSTAWPTQSRDYVYSIDNVALPVEYDDINMIYIKSVVRAIEAPRTAYKHPRSHG